MELNRLYNMDCLPAMRKFPDNYFQLAICDPPYGVNLSGGRSFKNGWNKNIDWDKCNKEWNLKIPKKEYFIELQRISRHQIIWGGNYFANMLFNSECWLVWDKGQRNFSLADGEMAWTSFNKAMRIFTYARGKANQENLIQPAQKPIALYKWILRNFANPDMKIIDTHAGSCSSVIAFLDFGCEWIAFEKDFSYYTAAMKRINNHKAQYKLEL